MVLPASENRHTSGHLSAAKARPLAHQDIMVAPHRDGDEVDDRANTRNRLKVLVDDQPPISNKIYFRLHDSHKLVRLPAHEVRQHHQPAAFTGRVVL